VKWNWDTILETIEGLGKIVLTILVLVLLVMGTWAYHTHTRRSLWIQFGDFFAEAVYGASAASGMPGNDTYHNGTFKEILKMEEIFDLHQVTRNVSQCQGWHYVCDYPVYHSPEDGGRDVFEMCVGDCHLVFYFEVIYEKDGSIRMIKEISQRRYDPVYDPDVEEHCGIWLLADSGGNE